MQAIVKNKRQRKVAQDYADMMTTKTVAANKSPKTEEPAGSESGDPTSKASAAASEGKQEEEKASEKKVIPEELGEGDESDGSSMNEVKMMEQ